MRYDCGGSGTRGNQLAVGHIAVDTRFRWESEHTFSDHRSVHLVRAAADRSRELLEQLDRPLVAQRARGAEEGDAELGAFAARFRPEHLHHGTVDLGTTAAAHRLLHPVLHVTQDLFTRVDLREPL